MANRVPVTRITVKPALGSKIATCPEDSAAKPIKEEVETPEKQNDPFKPEIQVTAVVKQEIEDEKVPEDDVRQCILDDERAVQLVLSLSSKIVGPLLKGEEGDLEIDFSQSGNRTKLYVKATCAGDLTSALSETGHLDENAAKFYWNGSVYDFIVAYFILYPLNAEYRVKIEYVHDVLRMNAFYRYDNKLRTKVIREMMSVVEKDTTADLDLLFQMYKGYTKKVYGVECEELKEFGDLVLSRLEVLLNLDQVTQMACDPDLLPGASVLFMKKLNQVPLTNDKLILPPIDKNTSWLPGVPHLPLVPIFDMVNTYEDDMEE